MRILRVIRNDLIATAVICAAGYAAYELLLDDRAKHGLKAMCSTLANSYITLSGMVNDRIGTIMDEEVVTQNREQIREQWANLGY